MRLPESLNWLPTRTPPWTNQHPPEQRSCHPNTYGGALPELPHLHGYKQPAYICLQILSVFFQNQFIDTHSQISTDLFKWASFPSTLWPFVNNFPSSLRLFFFWMDWKTCSKSSLVVSAFVLLADLLCPCFGLNSPSLSTDNLSSVCLLRWRLARHLCSVAAFHTSPANASHLPFSCCYYISAS